ARLPDRAHLPGQRAGDRPLLRRRPLPQLRRSGRTGPAAPGRPLPDGQRRAGRDVLRDGVPVHRGERMNLALADARHRIFGAATTPAVPRLLGYWAERLDPYGVPLAPE